jgi:hypothetical protein
MTTDKMFPELTTGVSMADTEQTTDSDYPELTTGY